MNRDEQDGCATGLEVGWWLGVTVALVLFAIGVFERLDRIADALDRAYPPPVANKAAVK